MTALAFTRRKRIEILLSNLVGERHTRRSLLAEVVDLATEDPCLRRTRDEAANLLAAAQLTIDEREFQRRLAVIEAQLP